MPNGQEHEKPLKTKSPWQLYGRHADPSGMSWKPTLHSKQYLCEQVLQLVAEHWIQVQLSFE